jgi:outer membrane protein OmpA-like peptidoglycan-associated protein
MKNQILSLLISLLLTALTACASTSKKPLSPAAQQAILLNSLQQGGVRRLVVGDELRLILPDARFFVPGTFRLKINAYPTLDNVVTLLNQQKYFAMDVVTFTPMAKLKQETSDLSKQQALAIENYLLDHGLSTRIITASAWDRKSQSTKRGVSFNADPPQPSSTEIRARRLHPEESE